MQKTLFVTLFATGIVVAQEPTSFEDRRAARAEVIDGRLGFDVTTQYFFRGMQQENQGLIFQPWIELDVDLWKSDDEERSLDLVFGQWNSLHNGPTGPGGGVWYESRFYVGVEGRVAERWHLGARLNLYANPNNAGGGRVTNITEWQFTGRFDDTGLINDDFSLQPHFVLAIEADNQRDAGNDEGVYLEVGITPSWNLDNGESPLTLSAPVRAGFGLADYYERVGGGNNDFFGYLQAGGVIDAALTFLPEGMGPWHGHAGLHLLILGDNNEGRNQGDAAELFFEFGMSTTF